MHDASPVRHAPIAMDAEAFRELAHTLVDRLDAFLTGLPDRPVAPGVSPAFIRALLPAEGLPEDGADPAAILLEILELLERNLTFNGHPRFWGYITASPAPIGMLADFIVSVLNPNLGLWLTSPLATEIELQTVRWLAEFLGYPASSGGIMSSGGQWANFIGLLVARQAKAPWDVRKHGSSDGSGRRLCLYASVEAHAWLPTAANLFGFGQDAVRSIPVTGDRVMDIDALRRTIAADLAAGDIPLVVVGTAGSVGAGTVDPLPELAQLCREHDIWFHVDGAYGAPAIVTPDAPAHLLGLREADSVAIDPHKWLYAPIDAGCTLVRDPSLLAATFSAHPDYYYLGDADDAPPVNLYEIGPENSRRFRSLKVWLALRQVGRRGYAQMIGDDIALARRLFDAVAAHPNLEGGTQGLSVTTFRYVPEDLRRERLTPDDYLNRLNRELLLRLLREGEALVSNAIVQGVFLLRVCVVNFRTTAADIDALPAIVARVGEALDRELRGSEPAPSSSSSSTKA